jgi:hypothetical protein
MSKIDMTSNESVVYIVVSSSHEGDDIEGVFSTHEKAEAFIASQPTWHLSSTSYSIDLHNVD